MVSGTQNSYLGNEDGNSLTADLGVTYGADQPGDIQLTTTFNGTIDVVLAPGLSVYDKAGNILTAEGINLVYAFDSGDLIAIMDPTQFMEDNYEAGYIAFRVAVDDTAGTYTVTIEDGVDGAAIITPIGLTSAGFHGGKLPEVVKDINTDDDPAIEIRVTATAYDIDDNSIITPTNVNWFNGGMGVDEAAAINGSGSLDGTQPPTGEILHLEFTNPEAGDVPILMTTANVTLEGFNGEIGYWEAYNSSTDLLVDSGYFGTANNPVTVNGKVVTTLIEASGEFDTLEFRSDDADGNGYAISQIDIVNVAESYDSALTYDFTATDADGDTVTGTFDVTFDGDGDITGTNGGEVIKGTSLDNTLDGGGGNDTIVFDAADSHVDGGEGYDTLQVDGYTTGTVGDPLNLDFRNVDNVEKIDLNDAAPQIITLSLDDVLDMTDSGNVLEITGGTGDEVTLTGIGTNPGEWTNDGFGLFTNNDDPMIHVTIESPVGDDVTIIPDIDV